MLADDTDIVLRAPRADTNWIAIIRTLDGVEIPCTVKDVSKTGARIGVPASCPLPDTFMLKIVGKDIICRVSLAWRKGNFVGVHINQFGKITPKIGNTDEAKAQIPDGSYKAIGVRRSRMSSF
ncbi:PilZ domain-containing protein [Methylobacterium sp. Leaf125]|uniref:PilZ domain-containing protein n=1 Tax=Methylobacterium sp. Leaf125 TaxID=1736265 RepID=UPI000A4F9A15|nr:PilZ domain-containing protein [Methylobacterium sp. Leaf125]